MTSIHETGSESDPGTKPLCMPDSSRYAGQPMDLSSRRSIQILSPATRSTPILSTDRHVTIDYFYHRGQYWKAVIPLDGVQAVFGQAFNFSKPRTRKGPNGPQLVFDAHGKPKRRIPCLNHVQSRFQFRPDAPVCLYERDVPLTPEAAPTHQIHDIVYSAEAVSPLGVSFNLKDAILGNLVNGHRFFSLEQMVFERIVVEGQYVSESLPLELSADVKRALLRDSILRSDRAGVHETYYMFCVCGTNNCTSTPLQILDRVMHYSWRHRLGSILYRLPLSPRFYLRIRGFDTDPGYHKLVREEFADYIQDPETQQRKRDYVRARLKKLREVRSPSNNTAAQTGESA